MATTKLLAGITAAALAIAGCGPDPTPPSMPEKKLEPKDALLDLEDLPETWALPSSEPSASTTAVPSCLSLVAISSTDKSAEVTFVSSASEQWLFNQVAIYAPAAANHLMDGLDARQIVCGSPTPDRPVPTVSRLSFEQVGDETVAFRISDPIVSFSKYNLVIYRHESVLTLISHGGRMAPDVGSTRALAEASLLEVEGAERKVRKSR